MQTIFIAYNFLMYNTAMFFYRFWIFKTKINRFDKCETKMISSGVIERRDSCICSCKNTTNVKVI